MKSLLKRQMKFAAVLGLLIFCSCLTLRAQTSPTGKLQLDDLDRLAPKGDGVRQHTHERAAAAPCDADARQ
jgi:hypothetical protein